MREAPGVLIVAISGRALAASARRAGYAPLVADLFCDDDTRALAKECVRIGASPSPRLRGEEPALSLSKGARRADEGQRDLGRFARWPREPIPTVGAAPHPALRATFSPRAGRRARATVSRTLDPGAVIAALDRLAVDDPIAGVVYGTGLEESPGLIDAVARRWPLLGNPAGVVARLKDPATFAEVCRAAEIPHPEIAFATQAAGYWLAKRRGGSGGSHIVAAEDASAPEGTYFQRRVAGRAVSALFLADGACACILGFSEQWTAPTRRTPFRYGGAVQPADLTAAIRDTLRSAVERLVADTALVGLCSADFLVDGDFVWCLEINPRPGATLDIFEPDADSLLALHMRACAGYLPSTIPICRDARAAQIVYAARDIPAVPSIDWPTWAADRQPAGSFVAEGEPFCTVSADAATKDEALRRLRARAATIWAAATGRAA